MELMFYQLSLSVMWYIGTLYRLRTNDARPSVSKMLSIKFCMCSSEFVWLSWFLIFDPLPDDVIEIDMEIARNFASPY